MADVNEGAKEGVKEDLSDKSAVSRALIEYFENSGKRPVIVASHPRSGTHLLLDALRLNFRECRSWKFWGERNDYLYLLLVSAIYDRMSVPSAVRIARRARRPLFKSHAKGNMKWDAGEEVSLEFNHSGLPPWLCRNATFLYIYRDGRDVISSWHTYHSGSRAKSGKGPAVPFSEFIRQPVRGVSRVRLWADHVRGWLDNPAAQDVYPVKMEDLLARPSEMLRGVAEKLNLRLQDGRGALPSRLRNYWHSKINRLLSIRPESTAIHPESDPTDWRRFFTNRDDRRFFLAEAGDLLVRLGYEPSDAWVDGETQEARVSGRDGGAGDAGSSSTTVVRASAIPTFSPPARATARGTAGATTGAAGGTAAARGLGA